MRIVAGEYGSRRLETLKGERTRPTLDKVREAVFSSLGGSFTGGKVLDLYAGSGAIGLEALSRGFESAVFVDVSSDAVRVIRANIASLHAEDRSKVYCMKDTAALHLLGSAGSCFDLVYLDPPYARQKNMEILGMLENEKLVQPGGRVVIEALADDVQEPAVGSFRRYKEAVYGITRIVYYRMEKEEQSI